MNLWDCGVQTQYCNDLIFRRSKYASLMSASVTPRDEQTPIPGGRLSNYLGVTLSAQQQY